MRAETSRMPYLYHPLWFCGRRNPCRLTDKETREKKTHGEEKQKGRRQHMKQRNYELLATDKVRREYVKNNEYVFLIVKNGHRSH